MRCVVAVVLGLLLSSPVVAEQPSFQDLEESLTCQCGCGLTVHSCNHINCGSAIPLRAEIREELAKGLDKQGILAHFVDKYGEKILSSPTTSGFNLSAWVMPFLVVGVGGMFVMWTLLRWNQRRAAVPVAPLEQGQESGPSQYDKILEQELDRFDT